MTKARPLLVTLSLPGWVCVFFLITGAPAAHGLILWSDPDPRVIHRTSDGTDLLGGVVQRDDSANDALYFKFRVDPLSDAASEPYYAGFRLYEGDAPHLAVGNAPEAWGYSAYGASETGTLLGTTGEFDLKSSRPEAAGLGAFKPYELPRHNQQRTIIFKVQYVPGGDDLITVWLSPRLTRGATDENQPENLTTKFKANGAFNELRLQHAPPPDTPPDKLEAGAGGNGWIFSDMMVATSFSDFIVVPFWQTWWFMGLASMTLLAGVALSVRLVERRKYQMRLRLAEQERALQRERERIAQDLHDDLGSSLARISLLCGLAKTDAENPGQLESHMLKIAESADETVRALEEIVWAVRPGSDTLQSLVDYITHFSNELFEGGHTRCRLDMPEIVPARTLPPETRHNTFLVVKEALTNVLKHSGAREVRVQVKAMEDVLEITIQDDGRGLSENSPYGAGGNGIGNMKRRAGSLGGKIIFETGEGKGTTVRLNLNLPKTVDEGE